VFVQVVTLDSTSAIPILEWDLQSSNELRFFVLLLVGLHQPLLSMVDGEQVVEEPLVEIESLKKCERIFVIKVEIPLFLLESGGLPRGLFTGAGGCAGVEAFIVIELAVELS
jgi:hypothetical protein